MRVETQVRELLPAPPEGVDMTITKVEEFQSPSYGDGLRVTFSVGGQEKYSLVLWLSSQTSESSRLGQFIVNLGREVDDWIGTIVRFDSLRQRNCVLVPVEFSPKRRRKKKYE